MGSRRYEEYGSRTKCVRVTFIACNCFFLLLSVLGLGIGIWGTVNVHTTKDYSLITGETVTSNTRSSGAVLIVSSIINIGLCVLGIIGAVFMLRPLLTAYAVVLGIMVILQLVSAILGFVALNKVRGEMEDNLEEAIKKYTTNTSSSDYDEDRNQALEDIQDDLKCCGIHGQEDWYELNPEAVLANGLIPPAGCQCDPDEDGCDDPNYDGETGDLVWATGCLDRLELIVRISASAVAAIAIIIMLIEVTFISIAICLCATITKTRGGLFV